MRTILLLFLLAASCRVMKEPETKQPENSISFVVLNIHQDSTHTKHVVEFVSKIQSSGEIKKQNRNRLQSANYLSIYVYNNKTLIDSQIIDHPLYKHLEYLNANNSFTAKDTVLDKAEFFIRCQTQGRSNEIKISETINHVAKKDLTTIKL